MSSLQKASCIICAYNEEKRIGGVLAVLEGHALIAETIVVDDGSTDGTADIVRKYPWVRLISQEQNAGKSAALAIGIAAAKNEFLVLLDADLIGLTKQNVTDLVEPVLSGDADMTISIRKNSLGVYKLLDLDFISGERAFRKSLIANHLDVIALLPGFSLEVFINELAIKHTLAVKTVRWKNVTNPRKSSKTGLLKGTLGDLMMMRDILKVLPPYEIVLQNYHILSQLQPAQGQNIAASVRKILAARANIGLEKKVSSEKHRPQKSQG